MTDPVDLNKNGTPVCIIDTEEWARFSRRDYPMNSLEHMTVCTTRHSKERAASLAKDKGYPSTFIVGGTVYIVINRYPETDVATAEHIAATVYDARPNVQRVLPASSQAGLASFPR